MKKFFTTSDLPLAAFLVCRGFKCLASRGTPQDNSRREFIIEYHTDEQERLDAAAADYKNGNDTVSANEFYRAQKRIKRYLDDPF